MRINKNYYQSEYETREQCCSLLALSPFFFASVWYGFFLYIVALFILHLMIF